MFENFKIISFPYVVWSHSAIASLCTVLRKEECFGAITVTPKPLRNWFSEPRRGYKRRPDVLSDYSVTSRS